MRRNFWFRVVIFLFFLFGLLPANSCRNPTGPSSGVVQVSQEEYGVKLILENASTELPAKVKALFKVQTLGKPDTALVCSNFTLFEDEAPISAFEDDHSLNRAPQQFKMRALLLLDVSGSIVKHNFDSLKIAAKALVVGLLHPNNKPARNIEVSVFAFDGGAVLIPVVGEFTANTPSLLQQISDMKEGFDKSTNLNGAVIDGIKRIKAGAGKTGDFISHGSLVIFSDGTDRAGRFSTAEALKAVQNAGEFVSIYTIGLFQKTEPNAAILQQFGKNGHVTANTALELLPKFLEIANLIDRDVNSRYLIEYCSPKRKGRHRLKIQATAANGIYGSITIEFSADNFAGGCKVEYDYLCKPKK